MQPVIHRAAWFCGNTGAGRTRHLWSTGTRRRWRLPASQLIQNCWWIVGERPRLRVFRLTQQQAGLWEHPGRFTKSEISSGRESGPPPASESDDLWIVSAAPTQLHLTGLEHVAATFSLHRAPVRELAGCSGGGARQIQNQPHGGVTLWSHVPPLIVYTTGRKTRWQHF